MIQVNRIYLIFNRLVTKKFLVDTSELKYQSNDETWRIQKGCAIFSYNSQDLF